jgi:hypothetical protein
MNNEDLKPIVVNSMNDVRKAISPFIKDIVINKVGISGSVVWSDDNGQKHTSNVNAHSSDVSIRQSLLDGFDQVKEQHKMWGDIHDVLQEDEYGTSLPEPDIDDMLMPVDRLIRYRLGGKREGMTVVWELMDRKAVFDPYTKKLDEIPLRGS